MQKSATQAVILVLKDLINQLEKGELILKGHSLNFPTTSESIIVVSYPLVKIEMEAYIIKPENMSPPKSDC
jgi:hypothetical protein